MDITTFLKENNARLSYEDKWLVWTEVWCQWQVYQQVYRRRVSRIHEGESLEDALGALGGEEENLM